MPPADEPLPLPAPIHYELLLQLLEQKTLPATYQTPLVKAQVRELIITLRKAMAQQRQLEDVVTQANLAYEHYWSINRAAPPEVP